MKYKILKILIFLADKGSTIPSPSYVLGNILSFVFYKLIYTFTRHCIIVVVQELTESSLSRMKYLKACVQEKNPRKWYLLFFCFCYFYNFKWQVLPQFMHFINLKSPEPHKIHIGLKSIILYGQEDKSAPVDVKASLSFEA